MQSKYCLMHEDNIVLCFDTDTKYVNVYNDLLLPITMKQKDYVDYDSILVFCSNRVLMMSRTHCKEILLACNIENQTDLNICIISMALSFRDNYWVKSINDLRCWKDVNLYDNEFSAVIANVALTGNLTVNIGDELFTGELTGKGSRPKCYVRQDDLIYLVKNESISEIASEIVSYPIALSLGLEAARYYATKYNDLDCSLCELLTSKTQELIPFRDIMVRYNESQICITSDAIKYMLQIDKHGFIKMFLFDYVTLNTDRNRDNFGLWAYRNEIKKMFPLYDHDSCFKGKSTSAVYFPFGMNFEMSLEYLMLHEQLTLVDTLKSISSGLQYLLSGSFKEFMLRYKPEVYSGFVDRVNRLLSLVR